MKPVGSFSRWVAFGVAMAAISVAAAVQAADGRAVVDTFRGTAEYAERSGDWQTLTVGKVLGPGSTVRTGAGSQLVLLLGDNGPGLTLTESTTVGLDRLSIDRTGADVVIETQLDLRAGTILGTVKKLSPASKYEVKTPRTVVGIKATEGPTRYQISADGKTVIQEGSVLVVYTRLNLPPTTTTVNTGQTFVPPVSTAAPEAVPTVRPVQPGDIIGPFPPTGPGRPTPPPVTVVPEPVQFISPGSGIGRRP